jgi:hypothetical protein
MKRLKSYKLFESESRTYDIGLIEDMLFDYSDKDINVNTNEGSWVFPNSNVGYIKIDIRNTVRFKIEECLFDVIDYLEGCGLILMDDSWMWNDMWQYYVGCPNCLSDDIEDNYNLTMKTVCHRCEYTGPADRFLVDRWPVDRKVLLESIEDGRLINQIQLTFSDRKSLY